MDLEAFRLVKTFIVYSHIVYSFIVESKTIRSYDKWINVVHIYLQIELTCQIEELNIMKGNELTELRNVSDLLFTWLPIYKSFKASL